jgi:hypothetical protein
VGRKIKIYRPSQAEIDARIEAMTWMTVMGWPITLVDSIMYHDNPTISTVREMVYRHGPEKARAIIERIVL